MARSGLRDVALYPARAAVRASRHRLEASVEDAITGPELARVLDRILAGPFPEELGRMLADRRVLERIAAQLAADGRLEEVVERAVAQPAVHEALRRALAQETASVAGTLASTLRARTRGLDPRVDWARSPAPPEAAGVVTRAVALVVDAAVIGLVSASLSAMAALVASLVGSLRPVWLVSLLLTLGWGAVGIVYFSFFWSLLGQTPGMRLMRVHVRAPGGAPPSLGRAVLRSIALAAAIIPCFAGFLPALFDQSAARAPGPGRRYDRRERRLRDVRQRMTSGVSRRRPPSEQGKLRRAPSA